MCLPAAGSCALPVLQLLRVILAPLGQTPTLPQEEQGWGRHVTAAPLCPSPPTPGRAAGTPRSHSSSSLAMFGSKEAAGEV